MKASRIIDALCALVVAAVLLALMLGIIYAIGGCAVYEPPIVMAPDSPSFDPTEATRRELQRMFFERLVEMANETQPEGCGNDSSCPRSDAYRDDVRDWLR